MVFLGLSEHPPHTAQKCCHQLPCSYQLQLFGANRSSKSLKSSLLRAFKLRIRTGWKTSVGWDVSINCAASPLMMKTPEQWGNYKLEVTVAVHLISTCFGLLSPEKPTPVASCESKHEGMQAKHCSSNEGATGERKRFSQHSGKNTTKFNRTGRFLEVLVWFWDTRGWSYWKVLPFTLLQSILTEKTSSLLSAIVQTCHFVVFHKD